MHAIRVLEEDHARIETLLGELAGADVAARTGLSERLANEVMVHTIAEDHVFLPHVEEAIEDSKRTTGAFFDGDAEVLAKASGLVKKSHEHNERLRDLLRRLRPVPTEEEIDGLREAIKLHAALEEELFPEARKVLEAEDFERIGDLTEHCKFQVRGLAQARLASSSFRPSPVETT